MMYNIKDSDYKFIENAQSDFYGIKILTPRWKDVIIIYGAVKLIEDKENDQAKLQFSWQLEDSSFYEPNELKGCNDFKNYLGDLLAYIIDDGLKHKEAKIGTANSYSEPLTEQ